MHQWDSAGAQRQWSLYRTCNTQMEAATLSVPFLSCGIKQTKGEKSLFSTMANGGEARCREDNAQPLGIVLRIVQAQMHETQQGLFPPRLISFEKFQAVMLHAQSIIAVWQPWNR